MLDDLAKTIDLVAEVGAKRVRRPAGDLAVRVFAGAFVGAVIAVWLQTVDKPAEDTLELFDAALGAAGGRPKAVAARAGRLPVSPVLA